MLKELKRILELKFGGQEARQPVWLYSWPNMFVPMTVSPGFRSYSHHRGLTVLNHMDGPNMLYEIGFERCAVRTVGADMGPQTSVG